MQTDSPTRATSATPSSSSRPAGALRVLLRATSTMSNELDEAAQDFDLGSGGAMLLPDLTDSSGTVRHLVVGAGKDGNLYVVNRDLMGKFSPSANNIWQQLSGVLAGGIWSTPAYFNGSLYYGPTSGSLVAFAIKNAQLSGAPSSSSSNSFGFP